MSSEWLAFLAIVGWSLIFTVHILPRLAGERARARMEAWVASQEGQDAILQLFVGILTSDGGVDLARKFASTLGRSLWGQHLAAEGQAAQVLARVEGAVTKAALGDSIGPLQSLLKLVDPELASDLETDPVLLRYAAQAVQRLGLDLGGTGMGAKPYNGGGGRRGV